MFIHIKRIINKFLQDKNGVVVLIQPPNLPIVGWFVFMVVGTTLSDTLLKKGFIALSGAFLFVWAYLEITQGVTYLRRLLGVVIVVVIIVSYFSK
jgi:hypothetical protein